VREENALHKAKASGALSLLTLALLVAFTPGCGVFQSQQEGGGDQNTLTLNLEADIADLNPSTVTDVYSFNVLNNVMEGLYRLDENEKPQPAMAESVETSDDKLTYTFNLREGIEWSNGEPVTSQDFKYAWLRAIDPDTASQYARILADYIDGGADFNAGEAESESVGIETPDDRTLVVKLVQPTPFFLGLTAFPTYFPLNQEFVERQGDQFAQSADALLHNGPYTLSEFSPSEGVTFVKNDGYWDEQNVDIEQVKGRVVKEADTAVNLYQSGELDAVNLTSEYVDQYRDSSEFTTQTSFGTGYLEMNQEDPVFQNQNIRQAILRGLDRRALALKVLNNGSQPADGFVPTGVIAGIEGQTFREAAGPVAPEFDPRQARVLYEQGVRELGNGPTLELLIDDTSESRNIATFLQSQFEENLGAKVEVNQQPFDKMLELTQNGDYQLAAAGWAADYNDPMTFLDLFLSDSPSNHPRLKNQRYDRFVSDAKSEADPQERLNLLVEAERLLVEEQAAIAPTTYRGRALLVQPYVKNYKEHPYGPTLELKSMSIEK
jgi:oligopeptide transport system substrate-binding protein